MNNEALDAIEQADLNPAHYRTAVRLARLCAAGPVHLAYDEVAGIVGTASDNTVRGHLAALHAAGLIGYKRNSVVAIWWTARRASGDQIDRTARAQADTVIAPRANRAPHDQSDRPTITPEAANDDRRAPHDQIDRTARDLIAQRAIRAPHDQPIVGFKANYRLGRQASQPILPSLGGAGGAAPTAEDQKRSIALLTDEEVGLDAESAAKLAALYPFEEIRRQVFRLRRDLVAGKVRSAGALFARLRDRYGATVTDEDRRTALWARHTTPEDEYEERRRRYIPDDFADIAVY